MLLRVFRLLWLTKILKHVSAEKFRTQLVKYNQSQLEQAVALDNFTYYYPILKQIYQVYIYRTFITIIIILTSSYLLAIIWRIFVTIMVDWENNQEFDVFNGFQTFYSYEDYDFVDEHGNQMRESTQFVRFIYFALTTLSTVGYGDFNPKSLKEKLMISGVLFICTVIFSLIVNQLISVLKDFKKISLGSFDEKQRNLTQWIGLLAYINKGVPIRKDIQIQIEDFFDYYWKNDRSRTLKCKEDKKILDEL